MNIHRWTSLGRGYDLGLKHNRIILILSIIGALVAAIGRLTLHHVGWFEALLVGFTGGAITFSAGVIAKELVPDFPQTAVAAAALSLIAVWFVRPESLLLVFWLIGGMRLLNRTSGLAAKPTDVLVLIIVTGWLVWRFNPLFGLLMALVLWFDTRLPDGQRSRAFAGFIVIFPTIVYMFRRSNWQPPGGHTAWMVIALLVITLAFTPVILNSHQILAVGDATGEPLTPSRVQAGQFFALATGLTSASFLGIEGFIYLISLWAAILAVAMYDFAKRSRVQSLVSV